MITQCGLVLFLSVTAFDFWTSVESKTVLVSFDGFRWDYMYEYREVLPTFWRVANEGVMVDKGLMNAFITKTCPNHRTISTGLWEESHGMIANNFWAPDADESFDFSKNDIKFWGQAEPFWTVAERSNVTSVCLLFPGCSVKEQSATYTLGLPYSNEYPFPSIVDNLTMYFNKEENPGEFGVLYYYEPDSTGHEHGPHSTEMRNKLAEIDGYLNYLLSTLSDDDDVIITSDHGMAEVPANQIVTIGEYLNASYYDHAYFQVYTELLLYSKEGFHDLLMDQVMKFVQDHKNFTAYSKSDILERWHYKYNDRIPDILLVADYGWLVVEQESSIEYLKNQNHIGQHGFDNIRLEMHPLFIAKGSSFKRNFTLPAGQMRSVDIYSLVGRLLGFSPDGRNGTLANSLPLLREDDSSILLSGKTRVGTSRVASVPGYDSGKRITPSSHLLSSLLYIHTRHRSRVLFNFQVKRAGKEETLPLTE
ncbi:ectonucleotide pyrophosphatase/phosphodiesterase family member 5-like isoform X2 [Convolutriloba macropyga]|uniref:ectonucleotide pyrophosphatase/phosphodiesterase family member 5-like isoform X2 n=1 Tax=Convolutriloba macropyga TaxID=536237 RepID=UPI003F51DCE2